MRNFLKIFKGSSLLNILGMTAAFASLYILLVQVNFDLGYNKSIKDIDKIYYITGPSWYTPGNYGGSLNRPLTKMVVDQSPMVTDYGVSDLVAEDSKVKVGDGANEREYNLRFLQITQGGIKLFGYEALQGSFDNMGKEMSVAVSESAAKLMGISVGDGIRFDDLHGGEPVTVAAVYKDMPMNSDLDMDILFAANYETQGTQNWNEWGYRHFVKINNPEDVALFEEQAREMSLKYIRDFLLQFNDVSEDDVKDYANKASITAIPFGDVYFAKNIDGPPGRSGNKTTTLTLLAVAILIIVITLINFVNFFFAQVPTRIRSVNTRKILGSSRSSLIARFMAESGILVVISLFFAVAVVLVFKSSTYANLITCSLDFSNNISVILLTAVVALVVTIASSVYPALYITSFSPAFAIKGSFGMTQSGKTLRYTLIGLQFVISISFLICAMFIKMQHSYMMNYDMGFNKENLFTVRQSIPINGSQQKEAFETELLKNPQIKDCTWAQNAFVTKSPKMGWGRTFKGENISFDAYPVSTNFLRFMDIEVLEGRDFVKSDDQSEKGVFIFNMNAKEKFGFTLEDKVAGHVGETDIAGFCENFQFRPLHYGIEPFALYIFGKEPWWEPLHLYFRTVENANIKEVFQYVRETIVKFAPNYSPNDFQVQFFNEELGKQYEKEQQLTKMVTLFTLLAIIISLMGVLGLVIFETQYRRKEIGVRRVHGATIEGILKMFNMKFAKILLICMFVAAPVSWYIIDYYYSSFVYRSPIHWWVFALAFVVVALIVACVVTFSSWKAATENPVSSLRSE